MSNASTAGLRLAPADRLKALAGSTAASGIVSAIGDFVSPADGWKLVGLVALISIVAVGVLWLCKTGPKWLESFFGPEKTLHWLSGKNRRWAIAMMMISSAVCCFTAWKSIANADEGGFLASNVPLVAELQDKMGIREVLARQGISWDSRIVRQAFNDDDVETLESFIKGGWNITGANCCVNDIAAAFEDKRWSRRLPLFEMLARNGVDFIADWVDDEGSVSFASPLKSAVTDGSAKAVQWVLDHGDRDSLPAYVGLVELYSRYGSCLDDRDLEDRLALVVAAGLPAKSNSEVYTALYAQWFSVKHALPPSAAEDAGNSAVLAACERNMSVVAPEDPKLLQESQVKGKTLAKAPQRNDLLSQKACLKRALMLEWYRDMAIPRNTPARDSETVPVDCRGEYAYEMVQAREVRAAIKRMDGYIAELEAL